jgi:hypothetical protein
MTERRRALSVRQPHAEGIMRGRKKIEYRSRPTNVRGVIYIYASKTRRTGDEEWMEKYRMQRLDIDELPRGVIIGTVELYDCQESEKYNDEFHWLLRHPQPAKRKRKPTNRPQPVWFYPFG